MRTVNETGSALVNAAYSLDDVLRDFEKKIVALQKRLLVLERVSSENGKTEDET